MLYDLSRLPHHNIEITNIVDYEIYNAALKGLKSDFRYYSNELKEELKKEDQATDVPYLLIKLKMIEYLENEIKIEIARYVNQTNVEFANNKINLFDNEGE